MKIFLKTLVILVGILLGYEVAHLTLLQDSEGWASLAWMESVPEDGPSASAAPEDEEVAVEDVDTSEKTLDVAEALKEAAAAEQREQEQEGLQETPMERERAADLTASLDAYHVRS